MLHIKGPCMLKLNEPLHEYLRQPFLHGKALGLYMLSIIVSVVIQSDKLCVNSVMIGWQIPVGMRQVKSFESW